MVGHYLLPMKTDRENDVIFFEKRKEIRRMIPNHAIRNNDNWCQIAVKIEIW
jgi:hypothetical protein